MLGIVVGWLIKPVRMLADALTAEDTPKQLAWGIALGMVVGLVPKGNLIAIVLSILMMSCRINLGTAFAAVFAFSWVGMLLDPVSHLIGRWLLTLDGLTPVWTSLYSVPMAPWTSFNNTIVLGSLLIGGSLLWPTYRLALPLVERYQSICRERILQWKISRLVWGSEVASQWEAS